MLIKTKEELKKYISTMHKNTSHETLLSFIEQAEFKYVMPFVGPELMEELQEAYDAGTLNEAQQALMKLLGKAIAFYAMLDALPFLNASIGDAGVMENQNGGAAPARQWVYHHLENSTSTNADVFLDLALGHLEKHKDVFASWSESEAYQESKSLYINTTAELSRLTNLQGSRRAFMALQPFILRAEEFYIEPVLGFDLHKQLKDSLLDLAAQSEPQRELLRLVKRALAQYALVESVPELAFTHTGAGLKVLNENDGIRQRQSISMEERVNMASLARSRAEIYMEDLRRFLDAQMQSGEVAPGDNQQAYVPFNNTVSASFWI